MTRARRIGTVAVLTAAAALAALAAPPLRASGEPSPAAPSSDDLVELGRRLFFDPAASRAGVRSCADCHDPKHGWSDPAVRSEDSRGPTRRHSQTLIDSYASPSAHWDGEFASIEDLIRARIASPPPPPAAVTPLVFAEPTGEVVTSRICGSSYSSPVFRDVVPRRPEPRDPPGAPTAFLRADVADTDFPTPDRRLDASGRYRAAFRATFGTSDASVDRMTAALAAFCRSIRSGESDYDRWAAGDATAMSEAAQRGFTLFQGAGQCADCHSVSEERAVFTDGRFHVTGVGARHRSTRTDEDLGAGVRTSEAPRSFKTPTLRDVSRRGPYMHDGAFASLRDVARHYLGDAPEEPHLDPSFPRYRAQGTDLDDVVAFLRALASDRRPGEAPAATRLRARLTRLEFLDANGEPWAGGRVVLQPAGDDLPDADRVPRVLETDAEGCLEYVPPRTTHVRVHVEPGLQPIDGAWIPDTCEEAVIRLPLKGTGRLDVRLRATVTPPRDVVLFGEIVAVFPDRLVPTMTLALQGVRKGEDDTVVASYAGRIRSDLLGVGRWFPRGVGSDRQSILVEIDRYHVEQVDLTK